MANGNLNKAKKAKNDSFYTLLADIENELKHYKNHFKDKVVFCNCDDPGYSNFWRFFALKFEDYGLKKLIATHYKEGEQSYKMTLDRDESGCANNYGFDNNGIPQGKIEYLKGDGDFRSDECVELLKECDIVVTNPPFSLLREYIALLMHWKKEFLFIGNQNAITYKEVFPLLKENKMWVGWNYGSMEFQVPENYDAKSVYIKDDRKKYQKLGNITWFTNLDHSKRHEDQILFQRYHGNEDKYPKYDNYDAIEVSRVKNIPMDYYPQEMIVTEEELEQLRSAGKYVEILEELNNEEI